jgi:hypothetical protein
MLRSAALVTRHIGGMYRLHHQDDNNRLSRNISRIHLECFISHIAFLRSVIPLLVIANVFHSSPIVTLMMEAISSFETSVITRPIWRNLLEEGILPVTLFLSLI